MVTISDPILAVFSAHAEVVPKNSPYLTLGISILRARGGSSAVFREAGGDAWYSPRTRR